VAGVDHGPANIRRVMGTRVDRQQSSDAGAAPDTLGTMLAEVRQLITEGRAAAALERLEPLSNDDPRIRQLLGVAYYHADDYARAIEVLAPVVPRLSDDSLERREAVQVLGLSYYLAGRLAEALPLLEETSRWASDNMELAQVMGMAYIQTRQPDRARHALARAFGVDPDSPGARVLAAQLMVRVEYHDMADEQLRAALAADPRIPHAHFLLGQNAVFRHRLDEGIAHFEQELALNPANAMAHYCLGEAWSRRADWERAIPALQRSIWINPFYSGPYIVLGRAYLGEGTAADRRGHAAPRRRVRPEQQVGPIPPRSGAPAARPQPRTRASNSRSRRSCMRRHEERRPRAPDGRPRLHDASLRGDAPGHVLTRRWLARDLRRRRATLGVRASHRVRRRRSQAVHHRDQWGRRRWIDVETAGSTRSC
jgi:tetratricopeptide (TPR) repeat protein